MLLDNFENSNNVLIFSFLYLLTMNSMCRMIVIIVFLETSVKLSSMLLNISSSSSTETKLLSPSKLKFSKSLQKMTISRQQKMAWYIFDTFALQ